MTSSLRTNSTGNFDDINLVEGIPPPSSPPANGNVNNGNGNGSSSPGSPPRRQNTNPSNPVFYSLAHGCTIDDLSSDDEEENVERPKTKMEQLPGEEEAKMQIPERDNTTAVVAPIAGIGAPPPLPTIPVHVVEENPVGNNNSNKVQVPATPPKDPSANTYTRANNAYQQQQQQQQQQQMGPPPTGNGHSPPPIYTTVYPPGIYSALPPGQVPPAYMPPSAQFVHHQQQPTSTYIIDASTLSGMPGGTVLIHPSTHQSVQPVLITENQCSEYARRRRALAILSFMLCFFPMVFFLLMLLSTIREAYH